MPRGHKSKLRAREKRCQVQSETQSLQRAQVIAAEEEEAPCSSSSPCGGATSQGEERPSTSQAPPTTDHTCKSPVDEKAILLVSFMLRKYNLRQPITKQELLKCISKKYRQQFHEILRRASDLMVLAFGIEVKEVDPTRSHYMLVSKLRVTGDARRSAGMGLLMTILCVIFMKDNCAAEEDIWEVLNVMEIYDGKKHDFYGEPRKLITQDLVKDRYLEYQQVPNSDPPRYQFLWGPRAHAETSKMEVLEFLAGIHNTVPSAFPSWYEEALRDEEERARARFGAMLLNSAMAHASSRLDSSSFSHP
ncbi:PREDICTED: melanoma-associated antigen B10-like [Galeopterus variegatus]|uniref:Melanoma-associated antigen B10-like n=1 Tax=Galeopterus variegatus TaxID=482537 RepID=A0ABM0RIU1_GALVR|nr:PREDICTED: melanoma-associated antigen B10-like [Galeopterus variegatus]